MFYKLTELIPFNFPKDPVDNSITKGLINKFLFHISRITNHVSLYSHYAPYRAGTHHVFTPYNDHPSTYGSTSI